mmetsp:Transcript_21743/g.60421  ORF Transcript_21743/g.60421 Transcript_21743/m.60421 type:complete len:148 (-) Transcript_21743:206-649(-)|eukprot:CAMPEP_0168741514 /NCGR_PEP_ID=MMETSP0724-20121128/12556_1 /TAXON_ID=265536 /ORGANISM="Amphiprora sp., Strain CCMP467" /LENGTH=147 /DNA_ID=CAMNT_0008789027 /DNA_START=34 /DNA_END=477 /DNA_ORIENTATION=+
MSLEISIEKISPKCGYAESGRKSTTPYVQVEVQKSFLWMFKQFAGKYTTKSSADEVYGEKHVFEVADIKGAEVVIEVWDDHMGDRTFSMVGVKQMSGTDRKFLLGSCKIQLDHYELSSTPKPVKCKLNNTFKDEGAEVYVIFTYNTH